MPDLYEGDYENETFFNCKRVEESNADKSWVDREMYCEFKYRRNLKNLKNEAIYTPFQCLMFIIFLKGENSIECFFDVNKFTREKEEIEELEMHRFDCFL